VVAVALADGRVEKAKIVFRAPVPNSCTYLFIFAFNLHTIFLGVNIKIDQCYHFTQKVMVAFYHENRAPKDERHIRYDITTNFKTGAYIDNETFEHTKTRCCILGKGYTFNIAQTHFNRLRPDLLSIYGIMPSIIEGGIVRRSFRLWCSSDGKTCIVFIYHHCVYINQQPK
jgi:hypothetical protein